MNIAINLFPYMHSKKLGELLDSGSITYTEALLLIEETYRAYVAGILCNDSRVMGDGFVIYPELDPCAARARLCRRGLFENDNYRAALTLSYAFKPTELINHLQELPLTMDGNYSVVPASNIPTGILLISDMGHEACQQTQIIRYS